MSANAPCYDENCANPLSGMNYRTVVPVNVQALSGGVGRRRGWGWKAVLVLCVVYYCGVGRVVGWSWAVVVWLFGFFKGEKTEVVVCEM